MLGFINPPAARQGRRAFQFPSIPMNYPAPDMVVTPEVRSSKVSLTPMAGLDAAQNGMAATVRFSNTNWPHAAYEFFIMVGNADNYFFFQKRNSEMILRWGYVAQGTIVLVDQISINYLHDGMFTLGASVQNGRIDFCVNGYLVGYQTENIIMPSITEADFVAIGQDLDGRYRVNETVDFDVVKLWAYGLSTTELENATFEAAPLIGATRNDNLWTIIKAGQSNSMGATKSYKPAGLTYENADRIFMIGKDLTLRPYEDPYTTTANGNELTAFNDTGGYSGAGVMLDELASAHKGKDFAVMPCNRGGTGLVHNSGNGIWGEVKAPTASNGNGTRTSHYAFVAYLSMSIARQMGNALAIEWFQGESDAHGTSTVTAAQYQAALAYLFDRWRLVLPPVRIIVNLTNATDENYPNWAVIRQALAEFTYPKTYHVDTFDLPVIGDQTYHLLGASQYEFGLMVAAELRKRIK